MQNDCQWVHVCVSTWPLVISSEAQQALNSITDDDICVATNKGGV